MLVPTVARWRETLSGAENQVVVVMIPRKPGHKEIFRHLALLLACVIAGAADANGPELQLAVTDPRPVALAIAVLSERHGIAITYEDPRYEFEGDLKDVTSEVARSPIKPGQRILVPLGGALELTYSISPTSGKPEQVDALIRKILDTHVAGGRGSQFELTQEGNTFHVVPVMLKCSQGTWKATTSVLNTPINVAIEQRSGIQMVDAICEALTAAARVRVVVGIEPWNAMANAQIVDGGTNEAAGAMLSRVLQQLTRQTAKRLGKDFERPFVWQLLFDPTTQSYALNLSLVKTQAEAAAKPEEEEEMPPDPNAPDPVTARPRR